MKNARDLNAKNIFNEKIHKITFLLDLTFLKEFMVKFRKSNILFEQIIENTTFYEFIDDIIMKLATPLYEAVMPMMLVYVVSCFEGFLRCHWFELITSYAKEGGEKSALVKKILKKYAIPPKVLSEKECRGFSEVRLKNVDTAEPIFFINPDHVEVLYREVLNKDIFGELKKDITNIIRTRNEIVHQGLIASELVSLKSEKIKNYIETFNQIIEKIIELEKNNVP